MATVASDRKASAWSKHAPALAAWTDKHLVNHHKGFGHYRELEDRERLKQTAFTDKAELTLELL
jgi:hypothetical protein